jgi:hypothetical protein
MAAWLINGVKGKKLAFNETVLAILSAMRWAEGLNAEGYFHNHSVIAGGTLKTNRTLIANKLAALRNPEVAFGCNWVLTGQRATNPKDDGTVEDFYGSLSEEAHEHSFVKSQALLMQDPMADEPFRGGFASEFVQIIALIISMANSPVQIEHIRPARDTTSVRGVPLRTIEHVVLKLLGSRITVVNAPAIERPDSGGPRPNMTSVLRHWKGTYPRIVRPGDSTVMEISRPALHAAGVAEMELLRVDPSASFQAHSLPIEPNEQAGFYHPFLDETAKAVAMGIQILVNQGRPIGNPLSSGDVRLFLNRIYAHLGNTSVVDKAIRGMSLINPQ